MHPHDAIHTAYPIICEIINIDDLHLLMVQIRYTMGHQDTQQMKHHLKVSGTLDVDCHYCASQFLLKVPGDIGIFLLSDQ